MDLTRGVREPPLMDDVPDGLLERDDVAYEETVERLDAAAFERARQRGAELVGGVVVAVTNDAGEVLLVENDWMAGFGFPGGGVEPGEDWPTAAAREVEEETGVAVEIERPWRVLRQTLEHGDEQLTGHVVFYRAAPAGDEAIADDPGIEDEDIQGVGWFDAVPDRAVRPDLIREVLDDG